MYTRIRSSTITCDDASAGVWFDVLAGIRASARKLLHTCTCTHTAALMINLNVEGCGIVAATVHASSRAPLLLPLLLSHYLLFPHVLVLVRDGQTSPHRPRLVVSHST